MPRSRACRLHGATEATIRVFPPDGHPDGPGGFERHRVAASHATPLVPVGSLVPHLIDIPLSTGTSVVGRLQLHLPLGVAEPDLLASATLNNIGHQLAVSIEIAQFVVDLKRRQREGHGIYSVLLQSSRAIQLDVPVAVAPALMVQPSGGTGHLSRFTQPAAAASTRQFTWQPGRMTWQSLDATGNQIGSYTYLGADVPLPGDERVHLNLWLFGGTPPTDGAPIEVAVSSFALAK